VRTTRNPYSPTRAPRTQVGDPGGQAAGATQDNGKALVAFPGGGRPGIGVTRGVVKNSGRVDDVRSAPACTQYGTARVRAAIAGGLPETPGEHRNNHD
jgi:hypothetical protein